MAPASSSTGKLFWSAMLVVQLSPVEFVGRGYGVLKVIEPWHCMPLGSGPTTLQMYWSRTALALGPSPIPDGLGPGLAATSSSVQMTSFPLGLCHRVHPLLLEGLLLLHEPFTGINPEETKPL